MGGGGGDLKKRFFWRLGPPVCPKISGEGGGVASPGSATGKVLSNRELQILTRGRLQERDFLNTKYCSRVNQRHFGGKTW